MSLGWIFVFVGYFETSSFFFSFLDPVEGCGEEVGIQLVGCDNCLLIGQRYS